MPDTLVLIIFDSFILVMVSAIHKSPFVFLSGLVAFAVSCGIAGMYTYGLFSDYNNLYNAAAAIGFTVSLLVGAAVWSAMEAMRECSVQEEEL